MMCLLFWHAGDCFLRGAGFGSVRASGQLTGGVCPKQRGVCVQRCHIFLFHNGHLQHSAMCDGGGRNSVSSCKLMSCRGFKCLSYAVLNGR